MDVQTLTISYSPLSIGIVNKFLNIGLTWNARIHVQQNLEIVVLDSICPSYSIQMTTTEEENQTLNIMLISYITSLCTITPCFPINLTIVGRQIQLYNALLTPKDGRCYLRG